MEYLKRSDVLELITKIMQDESITHKQRSLIRQVKQLPYKDISDSDAITKNDSDSIKTEIITPEQVRKMSSEEIHKNYYNIVASMKYWN